MKLAVLGGSFNPIHTGHLHLADSALAKFGFDRLILVPANISPFKQVPDTCLASGTDRLDMILASITADPRIAVEDMELRRGGVSYTIDTIKEIIDRYQPEEKPALILGDDLIADFPQWKDAKELARIAEIIVARRISGSSRPEFSYPHRVLDNEVINVSSAMIRERIAGGKAWRHLVPQGARFIIEDRGLYSYRKKTSRQDRSTGSALALNRITSELIARVEDAARAAMSAKRFIHSRNTALMARDLALRYELDADAAYLAGIAHDMTKNQSSDLDHGRTAAVLLQKRFGIHNKDVLEAIEAHTAGKPKMGDLAKAVYIADKTEYSRYDHQNHAPKSIQKRFKETAGGGNTASLDELFYAVLENNIKWLKKTGIQAAKETILLQKTKGAKAAGGSKSYNQ